MEKLSSVGNDGIVVVNCLNRINTLPWEKYMPLLCNCAVLPIKSSTLEPGFDYMMCFGQQDAVIHDASRNLKTYLPDWVMFLSFCHCQEKDIPALAHCSQEKDEWHVEQCWAFPSKPSLMQLTPCQLHMPEWAKPKLEDSPSWAWPRLAQPYWFMRNKRLFLYATWLLIKVM